MADLIRLEISFFGAFRKFSLPSPMHVTLTSGATITQLREKLRELLSPFQAAALMEDSALADERAILQEDHVFTQNAAIALLPPVCGG